MRLALLADVHANVQALEACLEHARVQGVDRIAWLGDLVGYGADPGPVVERAREHAAQGAVVVLGNHDAAVLGRHQHEMVGSAQAAVDWTRAQLAAPLRDFLDRLPLTVREGDVLFVHAGAAEPGRWDYVTSAAEATASLRATDATYVFSGHVHEPALYFLGTGGRAQAFRPVPGVAVPIPRHRRWLAIAGSVGQPRDGNHDACYAVVDLARERMTWFRVAYDVGAAASRVRSAGLPERLALRLERGV